MAACFLCQKDVTTSVEKKKRKLLFGSAGSKYRRQLDDWGEQLLGGKISDVVSSDIHETTYICSGCIKRVDDWSYYLTKADEQKNGIMTDMGRYYSNVSIASIDTPCGASADTHSEIQTTPKRKRSRRSGSNVHLQYDGYGTKHNLKSPWTKDNVRRIVRGNYHSLSLSLTCSERTQDIILADVIKIAQKEVKHICSTTHNSVLRDTYEGVKKFSWETVWLELLAEVPTLMKILMALVAKPDENKPLLCMLVSMILKRRVPAMGLVQRAVSLLLYGNGVNKQVFNSLQPLMLCHSHYGTIKLLDRIAEDFDIKVLYWSDNLLQYLEDRTHVDVAGSSQQDMVSTVREEEIRDMEVVSSSQPQEYNMSYMYGNDDNDNDDDGDDGDGFIAQPYDCLDMSMESRDIFGSESDDGICTDDDPEDQVMPMESASNAACIDDHGTGANGLLFDIDDAPNSMVPVGDRAISDGALVTLVSDGHDGIVDDDIEVNIGGFDGVVHTNNANATNISDEADDHADMEQEQLQQLRGFKIVGDNIDMTIKPSFERFDSHSFGLHYFHSYAILDRIDLSGLSDVTPLGACSIPELLPSDEDVQLLEAQFTILVSRILAEYLPEYKSQANLVTWHMEHRRQLEMEQKSEVVPLGMILLNENRIDQMCHILEALHKYVPSFSTTKDVTLPNGETYTADNYDMLEVLIGGDQLTVARARSAIGIRRTHDNDKDKLLGLVPVVEDWHARLTLMQVIHIRLLNDDSGKERGTLTHIKNLIQQKALPKDPKANMKVAEDFYMKVLIAYIVVAAREILQTSTYQSIHELSKEVVNRYVRILAIPPNVDVSDKVLTYASELITLGLLWNNYHDAVREGDGERVVLIWKFLIIVFKGARRTNYSKEAVIFLAQFYYLFSKRKAEELIYSRFVNTRGRRGCNVPCDLHMEHLNRRLKTVLSNLRSNLQTNTIIRAAKSIGVVHSICECFEKLTANSKVSDHHAMPSITKELNLIINSLEEVPRVLEHKANRSHSSFKFKQSLLEKMDRKELEDWMANIVATHTYRNRF